MLRSRNGHDIFALRQHPGQRQLRRLNALLFCDFSHPPHQIKILLEILSLKPRRLAPVIIFRQIFESFELPGQKSATERAVRDKSNSKLSASSENLVLWIARPERVLGLQGSDGMNLHSSSQCLRSRFREPDMADFAFLHELRHCAYGLFNWRIRIDAMLVVQSIRSIPRRRKLPSHDLRTYSGLPFTPLTCGWVGSRTMPNFV